MPQGHTARDLSRRTMLATGLALASTAVAKAAAPTSKKLEFAIFRNGAKVGSHLMVFGGDGASPVVTTDVQMLVKLGPVPVYRYRHHAVERWSGGRFASLDTTTDANGKPQKVSARRTERGLVVETGSGKLIAAADTLPFTHWNPEVFGSPLFNPQEGKLLKVTAIRKPDTSIKLSNGRGTSAVRWSVRGEAEIDDWYDQFGVWSGLSGKLKDGSVLEYRRL